MTEETADPMASDAGGSNVLFELWQLSRAANALLAGSLGAVGMSGDAYGVYSVLATAEDGMTPTALAQWMSAPSTTVSSYIRRMESQGHATRRPDPMDGRGSLIRLTAAGRRAHRRATDVYEPILVEVQRQLDANDAAVRTALLTLRRAIDAAGG